VKYQFSVIAGQIGATAWSRSHRGAVLTGLPFGFTIADTVVSVPFVIARETD